MFLKKRYVEYDGDIIFRTTAIYVTFSDDSVWNAIKKDGKEWDYAKDLM